jgi:hypothetical protein
MAQGAFDGQQIPIAELDVLLHAAVVMPANRGDRARAGGYPAYPGLLVGVVRPAYPL